MSTLFDLLPVAHRVRDAEAGHPLRGLLGVLGEQLDAVEGDLDRLYDNWFIETCEEWVVPYLGDLLAVRQPAPGGEAVVSRRAAVANALSYRRRKGTAAVLERLSRDVGGWPAAVVEFFQRVATTQHLSHLRPGHGALLDLRDAGRLELLGGAFDPAARTAGVGRVRHHVRGVGVFACRLNGYPVTGATARQVPGGPGRYTFSPLGDDLPLFNLTRPGRATEAGLPVPLRRRALHEQIPQGVLRVTLDGHELTADELAVCHLADWRPPRGTALAAIDPELGRITLRPGVVPGVEVAVDYAYGFSGDLGGGPYDRLGSLTAELAGRVPDRQLVVVSGGRGGPDTFPTLAAAISAWNSDPAGLGVIAIGDSRSYPQSLPEIALPDGTTLMIVAAGSAGGVLDPRGVRPHLRADLSVRGEGGNALVLNGLLIEGAVTVAPGTLGRLTVAHCTLVPRLPTFSVQVDSRGGPGLTVRIERSVTGALDLPDAEELILRESIVDAGESHAIAAPALAAHAVTVLCEPSASRQPVITARTLEATNCLFTGHAAVQRRQSGCVRFSYVPPGSLVPRRFHVAQTAPTFTSTRYGDPGYAQLAHGCPDDIGRGADDGTEMGAFGFLYQPQRLDNLVASLREHTPFGVEAGIIFVT